MSDATRFVWVDLEMTGLDPETCAIIEMAMIITDGQLKPLGQMEAVIWQPEEVLARTVPFVRKMHTENGLLAKVRGSDTSLADAEQSALALLSEHCGYRKGILAGNSIHQDRRFLCKYMPRFEGFLHYRMLDVSSLKVLAQAWHGRKLSFPKNSSHTALEDIRSSIAELEYYRANLLKEPQ